MLTEKQARSIELAGVNGEERSWVVLTRFGPARITTRKAPRCWRPKAGTSIYGLEWIGGGHKVDRCWCASLEELKHRMAPGPFWAWGCRKGRADDDDDKSLEGRTGSGALFQENDEPGAAEGAAGRGAG